METENEITLSETFTIWRNFWIEKIEEVERENLNQSRMGAFQGF